MARDESLDQQVWQRARDLCEYCRLPQSLTSLPYQIDHIIAKKHDGETSLDNLALSCLSCNAYKGPNIAGIDPDSGEIVRLFHPRRDEWNEHFKWNGPELVGRTLIGRATIAVLAINLPYRAALRASLIVEGIFSTDIGNT